MAGYTKSSNPFETDDDKDDGFSKHRGYGYRDFDDPEEQRRQIMEQIDESEDRQVESTRRALASIYESERMGVSTAEELLRQGEQLNNIERKTTDISQSMKTAQKHLNSIKSVFGGIKNWWTTKKTAEEENKPEEKPSRLQTMVEEKREAQPHPALRMRDVDYSGFYNEKDLDDRFMAGTKKNQGHDQQYIKKITKSKKEEELNENLGMMSDGLATLKDLARGLGEEIDRQNPQIERITENVNKDNLLLENQNRQMKKILRN